MKRRITDVAYIIPFFVLMCISTPANAQNATTTKDLAWLTGTWVGHMSGDTTAHAETIFSAPAAGTVIGVMRLIQNNQVVVVELITITDTPTGPEMRFRHFSTAMEAYEPDFRQNMKFVSRTGDAFRFENSVAFDEALMSTQPRVTQFIRHNANEFVGHSDVLDKGNAKSVVEVTYRRVK